MTQADAMQTFDEVLRHWASERPDVVAFEQDDRRVTFAQAEVVTRRIVTMLRAMGVSSGDRIAWLGKNSELYFLLLLGAARCGAVMVPVGWRLAPAEIGYILDDTAAKLVFAGEEFQGTAAALVAAQPHGARAIGEGEARAAIASAQPAQAEPTDPSQPMLQLYTSGTTGHPKGAVLMQRNLLGLRPHALAAGVEWAKYEPSDCIVIAMPCAHIGGTGLAAISLANGVRALIQAEFLPDQVLRGIAGGVTHIFIVPAALQMVIQHPDAATTDFSSLKLLMYGAAPIPLELLREAVATMPNAWMMQVYGMTETSGTISVLPPEDHCLEGNERMRSAGKAVPGVTLAILGPDGRELPRGEIGEVAIHSPSNMAGYWNLPDATAQALRDGWMLTGDAARMDEDGYIYIQDRIKDMIISGGENVYPAEVESAIYGHPAVAEVAVIGVPSEKWGEEVKACVVARAGQAVDPDDVIAWARERVAAFKAPKSIDVIEQLPRNASGKILRRELRAPYWEGRERLVN